MQRPAPVDVDQLIAARGAVEARRDLEIRVTGDPRDVAGWLALAVVAERVGRPGQAIAALEAVEALGGPLGVRWQPDDRARLARLIAARGRARLARSAPTALADLERARQLGAAITDADLRAARIAQAIVALRHSDARTRDAGRRALAGLAPASTAPASGAPGGSAASPAAAPDPGDAAAWRGAVGGATPDERGRFGAWLWQRGARRAAWDELSAWHAATAAPRDPVVQTAYLTAARWWIPLDRPPPPADDLVGPMRCAFAACAPREAAGDEAAERALLAAPPAPIVRDPDEVAALVAITLRQALRGEAAWGPALAARIDLAALRDAGRLAALPDHARPIIARLVGHKAGRPAPPPRDATADQRLVLAAERVLAGATTSELAGLAEGSPYREALHRAIEPPGAAGEPGQAGEAPGTAAEGTRESHGKSAAAPGESAGAGESVGEPDRGSPALALAGAVVRHVTASLAEVLASAPADELHAVAVAYRRDPLIADRLGRDLVVTAVDAATGHAALGALFDALGDPARARASWQAAVDASAEPAFVRGLAEAMARQGDGDAALIAATGAAAASGDPAVVWLAVARGLAGAGRYVAALDAARAAIELAGPDVLAAALDVAITASHALGRAAQVAALAAQRARIAGVAEPIDSDPTDPRAALAAHQRSPDAASLSRLWLAARWNPRDVALRAELVAGLPADDARRTAIIAELIELAGDRDPEVRRAVVAALVTASR